MATPPSVSCLFITLNLIISFLVILGKRTNSVQDLILYSTTQGLFFGITLGVILLTPFSTKYAIWQLLDVSILFWTICLLSFLTNQGTKGSS